MWILLLLMQADLRLRSIGFTQNVGSCLALLCLCMHCMNCVNYCNGHSMMAAPYTSLCLLLLTLQYHILSQFTVFLLLPFLQNCTEFVVLREEYQIELWLMMVMIMVINDKSSCWCARLEAEMSDLKSRWESVCVLGLKLRCLT